MLVVGRYKCVWLCCDSDDIDLQVKQLQIVYGLKCLVDRDRESEVLAPLQQYSITQEV